ncbi:hypothetical protein L1987_12925 [Smallanthus sonchifolius]|uniref:Uncharacterized protein n=1 Tax=Smallanthus sonchifolius TaxID=185202 RepID=A0ACB9JIL3_9ASTR|nr:hypothetical protein L1987_12925 [Smallanthus sonchifolius]
MHAIFLQIYEGATHVNDSHVIHDLSLGPKYPRLHNPFDDTNRNLHGASGTFKYYIKFNLHVKLYVHFRRVPSTASVWFTVEEYMTDYYAYISPTLSDQGLLKIWLLLA